MEVRRLAGADLFALALSGARALFQTPVRGDLLERVRVRLPGGLRRFRVLSISDGRILGEAVPADTGNVPLGF